MAADLKEELNCSICLNVYTDPVTLRCGHNFCCLCIDRVLSLQKRAGTYTCPECRKRFHSRPILKKNITLSRIAERFHSQLEEQGGASGIFCTYCDYPTLAIKTCVQCETRMCVNHLQKHNSSVKHTLIPPTTDLEHRKCAVHKKTLEYYCTEDMACICVSCRLDGEHLGHQVESLEDAAEARKVLLRDLLETLTKEREENSRDLKRQHERRRKIPKISSDLTDRVTALFRDIQRQLLDLEKQVLNEISRQDEQISLSIYDLIQLLERKKDELSRKMRQVEELSNAADPLTVLKEPEWDSDGSDPEEEENERSMRQRIGSVDEGLVSEMLYKGLADIVTGLNGGISLQEAEDIVLDMDTAASNLRIPEDRKAMFKTETDQDRPDTDQRFTESQALSSQSFSSGRHYWDVETSKSGEWSLGVSYYGMDRGCLSDVGSDQYSWGLRRWIRDECRVNHNGNQIKLPDRIPSRRFRVFLDYEAGQVSFYELGIPIKHLYTFSTTFTEPVYAAFRISKKFFLEDSWMVRNSKTLFLENSWMKIKT